VKHSRWIILFVFMIAHGVNDGFMWVIPPLLPAIREYFHLSYTEMGGFLTIYRLFGSVLQAPAAYLVHMAPIHYLLVGGLLLSSVGMLIATMSAGYAMLTWIAAISGMGRATYHPLAITALSRLFGRDAFGRAMALHLSGSSTGMMVAPFLVGLLLATYGWRLPLQIWSTMGILAGLILFVFLTRSRVNLQPQGKTLRWPFFSSSLGLYLLAVSAWSIAQSGLISFLPLFLVDRRGFSPAAAAAAFGVMSVAGTVCRPALGALMDWMGRRKPVVVGGFLIASLTTLVIATVGQQWLLYAAIVLLGIFGSGHLGLADTMMIEMIPSDRREETLGAAYTGRMGIASLSPFLVGVAAERLGMTASFLLLAATGGLSVLLLLLVEERPIDESRTVSHQQG
jgi:FSR family fosmidomycin resistance protein-like MFS transporter